MKETQVPMPGSDSMIKQVSLEPTDLAKYNTILTEHMHWLSVARDFFPESVHLNQAMIDIAKIHKDIKELITYGVPTEIETESDKLD